MSDNSLTLFCRIKRIIRMKTARNFKSEMEPAAYRGRGLLALVIYIPINGKLNGMVSLAPNGISTLSSA